VKRQRGIEKKKTEGRETQFFNKEEVKGGEKRAPRKLQMEPAKRGGSDAPLGEQSSGKTDFPVPPENNRRKKKKKRVNKNETKDYVGLRKG